MRIAFILGTRPEFIKLAPVIRVAKQQPHIDVKVVFTGQHKEMLNGLANIFEIQPDINLDINYAAPNLSHLTSAIIAEIDEQLFSKYTFDVVVVQGDTTTAFSSALAAFYRHIPLAHVEAGLRTGNLQNPFPEELNRQFISKLSQWHFCPTAESAENLFRESVDSSQVFVSGNTVVDSLKYMLESKISKVYAEQELLHESPELFAALSNIRSQNGSSLSVLTMHRRENQGDDMRALFKMLAETSKKYPQHHLILPYHLNPKVKELAFAELGALPNIHLIPPLSYRPFVYLLSECDFVLSDSGGVQEEIPTFKIPLLILRKTTERPETLRSGCAKLVGTNPAKVAEEYESLIRMTTTNVSPIWFKPKDESPFGDGRASEKIIETLIKEFASSNYRRAG